MMAVMNQPAAMAFWDLAFEYTLALTPMTANTITIAPKTDIWRRCNAMESVASVMRTLMMTKSWTTIANHITPTVAFPTGDYKVLAWMFFTEPEAEGNGYVLSAVTIACAASAIIHDNCKPKKKSESDFEQCKTNFGLNCSTHDS